MPPQSKKAKTQTSDNKQPKDAAGASTDNEERSSTCPTRPSISSSSVPLKRGASAAWATPTKSTAVTQVANESVGKDGSSPHNAPSSPSSPYRVPSTIGKVKAIAASVTRLSITSNGESSSDDTPTQKPQESQEKPSATPAKAETDTIKSKSEAATGNETQGTKPGWLGGWWPGPQTKDQPITSAAPNTTVDKSPNPPGESTTPKPAPVSSPPAKEQAEPTKEDNACASTEAPRTWLSLLGGQSTSNQPQAVKSAPDVVVSDEVAASTPDPIADHPSGVIPKPAPTSGDPKTTAPVDIKTQKVKIADDSINEIASLKSSSLPSRGWAFWQREGAEKGVVQAQDAAGGAIDQVVDRSQSSSDLVAKKVTPSIKSSKSTKDDNTEKAKTSDGGSKQIPVTAASKSLEAFNNDGNRRSHKNLLLPSLRGTFREEMPQTLMQQITSYLPFTKSHSNSHAKHPHLLNRPPKIKHALAIGVHGYFPAPLIRSVLGQPKGTSVKFADMTAIALNRWAENHHQKIEVEKIALEGEGRIEERVQILWKLLLNYIPKIRETDFVMFACHSQGVPVTIMLIAKLISLGCLGTTKVGVCAMAGVSLGPFADYKSRWIGGVAGELFDFSLPSSKVSRDYEAALDVALSLGTKVTYIGSLDDQLVSMESSIFGPANHPNIYRAVFIDGRVHAPHFLNSLVGFALKLRNLGIQDHGLIRELSSSLGGSLMNGEGHSRLYDDEALYTLAIEFALETSAMPSTSLELMKSSGNLTQNPYILPFAMRGVLEEDLVRTELNEEVTALLAQFDEWKPVSKTLKDVKFRLEGVRSRL